MTTISQHHNFTFPLSSCSSPFSNLSNLSHLPNLPNLISTSNLKRKVESQNTVPATQTPSPLPSPLPLTPPVLFGQSGLFSRSQSPEILHMSSGLDYSQPHGHDFHFNNLSVPVQYLPPWSTNIGGASIASHTVPLYDKPRSNHRHEKRMDLNSQISPLPVPQILTPTSPAVGVGETNLSTSTTSMSYPNQEHNRTSNTHNNQDDKRRRISSGSNIPGAHMNSSPILNPNMMSHRHNTYSMPEPLTPTTAVSNDYCDDGLPLYQTSETDNQFIDAWLADYLQFEDTSMPNLFSVRANENTFGDQQLSNYLPQIMLSNQQQQQHQQNQRQQQQRQHQYLIPQSHSNDSKMMRTSSASTNQSVPMSPFMHSPAAYGQNTRKQKRPISPLSETTPKTMSPKEAMLDQQPSATLVPATTATTHIAPVSSNSMSNTNNSPFQASSMAFTNGQWSTDLRRGIMATSGPPMSNFTFATPALPANYSAMPESYLAMHSPHAAAQNYNRNPEFPAHLISMESSISDTPQSSGEASNEAAAVAATKPSTSMLLPPLLPTLPLPLLSRIELPPLSPVPDPLLCIYDGCGARLRNQKELQKHKKDHIQRIANATPGIGSGMSTAEMAARNSQTGPHYCNRVNPLTGKRCAKNFSRPYDLTRHEDTIHSIAKEKLRCQICKETKLFSRNDALVRHTRVVHGSAYLDRRPARTRARRST